MSNAGLKPFEFEIDKELYEQLNSYSKDIGLSTHKVLEIIMAFTIHLVESDGAITKSKIPVFDKGNNITVSIEADHHLCSKFIKVMHTNGFPYDQALSFGIDLVLGIENHDYKYLKTGM